MSPAAGGWSVQTRHGPVPELLAAEEPPADAPRLVRLHSVQRPALVLGSAQRTAVDRAAVAAAGVEVVRRRSGGGAVLLWPQQQVWADFFVPAGDPLWNDDVSEAALRVGRIWARALAPFAKAAVSLHSGRLVADSLGRLVCFGGQGPGEVLVGGLKVVGLSQRRTRHRARIQTAARLGEPEGIDELGLLDLGERERATGRADLARRRGCLGVGAAELTEALLSAVGAEASVVDPLRV